MSILYCCDSCKDHIPEYCGYEDPSDLKILPDNRWLCESCYDDLKYHEDSHSLPESYYSLPSPHKHIPITLLIEILEEFSDSSRYDDTVTSRALTWMVHLKEYPE